MKQLYFLSGLARTGSTVLASLLNQHPDIYVSPTSPLMDLLCATEASITRLNGQFTFADPDQHRDIYAALLTGFYRHIKKPIVFDKHRGWPRNGASLRHFVPDLKIVCTLRPIAEIIASFIKLLGEPGAQPNTVDSDLQRRGLPVTTANRAHLLWNEYIKDSYESMQYGLEHLRPHLLVLTYAEITGDTPEVLRRVLRFVGLRPYRRFNFEQLENVTPEKDADGWGIPGLHTIRPRLAVTSTAPEMLLGAELTAYFRGFDLRV